MAALIFGFQLVFQKHLGGVGGDVLHRRVAATEHDIVGAPGHIIDGDTAGYRLNQRALGIDGNGGMFPLGIFDLGLTEQRG